jgi:PhoH-like ATPase
MMINNPITRDIVVIDTSVILYDADCINQYNNCDIVIPLVVLDEVDKFRSSEDELGRNARRFIRSVDSLRKAGDLNKGALINEMTTSTMRVKALSMDSGTFFHGLDFNKNDNRILAVCGELLIENKSSAIKIILVSKDISLLVKASIIGIEAQYYSVDRPVESTDELYTGNVSLSVPGAVLDSIYQSGTVSDFFSADKKLYPNTCLTLIDESSPTRSALAMYRADKSLRRLKYSDKVICNVEPKNKEQEFAFEMMMDENIKLLTMTGIAGSGKTLVAVACGIHLVLNLQRYDRLVISRPVQPMGRDIGFLPGNEIEKMSPWMGPIKDAVEFCFNGDRTKFEEMIYIKSLEIEPLTYIRGRSMPKTLFILDESQNLTRHEMKTIISRIGKGSKIILTGDVLQIDNHYLDTTTNGLTVVVEKFKESSLAGHITFTKGQRSELASLAAEIL